MKSRYILLKSQRYLYEEYYGLDQRETLANEYIDPKSYEVL